MRSYKKGTYVTSQPLLLSKRKKWRWLLLFLAGALLASSSTMVLPDSVSPASAAQSTTMTKRFSRGVRYYLTVIDMRDRDTYVSIGLPKGATQANSSRFSGGAESFRPLVYRQQAAVVVTGTFFGMDANKWVMGNMVSGGRFLKYSPWENYGTTLGIGPDKRLEMVTARVDGKPKWQNHWFSLTAGPRLLRNGKVWIAPRKEGFSDRSVFGAARRAAIGYTAGGRKLIMVTFPTKVSLQKEALILRDLGCKEALNLDGGSSLGLARSNKILVWPGRRLTNVIAFYDRSHPAPVALRESWQRFSQGDRPRIAQKKN